MRRIPALITLVLLAAFAAAGGLPGSQARASSNQESLFQEDANLQFVSDARRNKTLNELRSLGVDVIRVNVVWNDFAQGPKRRTKPRGFNPSDPNDYRNLNVIDAIVLGARARGMQVMLTPTVPGPAWASQCKGSTNKKRICLPKPSQYGNFVRALGRRYGTSVRRWSLMNEPNLGAWLTPQYRKVGKRWIPRSPQTYRALVRAATSALARTGHGRDRILLGETAPIGRTRGSRFKRSIAPAHFYRELFCLNRRGRKFRGREARLRGCTKYKRLAVTGVAHHPYTRGAGAALRSRVGRDDITLVKINRLFRVMNRGAKYRRIRSKLPVYITEYGFQTNPPDRFAGTSLRNQARWINESDYIAYRYGRIRSVGQYELRDERHPQAFQTGLRFRGGKAKPSLAAYRLPLWVVGRRSSTKIWGQVRPAARLGSPQRVTIQYRKKGARRFRTLRSFNVRHVRGIFVTKTKVKARAWRLVWKGKRSRTAAPAKR